MTFVWPLALLIPATPYGTFKMTCAHGNAQELAPTRVQVGDHQGEWELLVGVKPDLPVPLLIGKDWPAKLPAHHMRGQTLQAGPNIQTVLSNG